ncbi:MAG: hypothetical protein LBE15_03970, partial [Burkholderiales bacterium]|nr:hypothetical protein [Burkholderiales bacterium]
MEKDMKRVLTFFALLLKHAGTLFGSAFVLSGLLLAMPVLAQDTFTVRSAADGAANTGNCVANNPALSSNCSLRDAIAAASAGDTIVFDLSANSVITLNSGQLTLNRNNLTIDGSGSPGIAISGGSGGNTSRVFEVPAGVTGVELKNLTVRDGNPGGGQNNNGGNILNAGTLTLTNCTVSNGRLQGQNFGAGIYNADTGSLTLTNATVSHNRSTNGAGGIYNSGALTLTGTTVHENNCNDDGSGIINAGTLHVVNSTVANNGVSQSGTGSGIHNTGTLVLINATVMGNQGGGGNINNATSASLSMTNTIVQSCSGIVGTDNGGNIDTGAVCGFTHGNSSSNVSNANLALGSLSNNGGPTLTMLPGAGSVAIGHGLLGTCTSSPVNGVDQRGFPRAIPPATSCTSGAVEVLQYTVLYDGNGEDSGNVP